MNLSTGRHQQQNQTDLHAFADAMGRQSQFESKQARTKGRLKAKGKKPSQSQQQHQGKS